MSRVGFGVEKLLRIYKENSDSEFIDLLFGSGVPGGDSGEQDAASIGSAYLRENGTFYQKIASTNATSDWALNGSSSVAIGKWRQEKLVAVTADTLSVGARDLVVSPLSDDEAPLLVAADFVAGDCIIGGSGSSPILYKVTLVAGDSITLALADTALVAEDTFICLNYLPNSPGALENRAIVNYNGSVILKLSDVNWEFATGINLSSGYAAINGSIATGNSVELAIEKLDGNQQDLQTLSGMAQGSVDLGTFSGSTIPDAQTVKQALQSLETAHESLASYGQVTVSPVTTLATIDSVLVDSIKAVKWYVQAFEIANPSRIKCFEIFAGHNGTAAADATATDDTVYAALKFGASFNLVLAVDINGATTSQVMRLRASSSTAGVSITVKREEVK